jgi:hypothetical protein
MKYTNDQLKFIIEKKIAGNTWNEITDLFNDAYKTNLNMNTIRHLFRRNNMDSENGIVIDSLKKEFKIKRDNKKIQKQNQIMLDSIVTIDELINRLEPLLKKIKLTPKTNKPPKRGNKTKLIIEPMITDIHFGLKTVSYDENVAKRRLEYATEKILRDIKRQEVNYDIEKIHLAMLGDFIQSASMHGRESARSCNLTDSEQIVAAIDSLFNNVILPLSLTGYPIDITGLSANHDRIEEKQHTVNPGKTYLTYVIYKVLEMLCKKLKIDNVKFIIPNEVFYVKSLFNSNFLYTHGHVIKGGNSQNLENELNKRQSQTGLILSGIRLGHFHNDKCNNLGRHIIGASTVSDDHYGNYLGYKSRPGLTINYYVDTERESSFYHSFTIDLSVVK